MPISTDFQLPLIEELDAPPDPSDAFDRLCSAPHCLFLDSALQHRRLGRYSFITADPFAFVRCGTGGEEPFQILQRQLCELEMNAVDGLPAFQGGAAGLFGYELSKSLERLPASRFDEFAVPPLAVGLYDTVLAYDHGQERAWLISQGWPAAAGPDRQLRAKARLQEFRRRLESKAGSGELPSPREQTIHRDALAPSYPTQRDGAILSNFTADQYRAAVRRAIDYIHAGDIFQVNLSQRLLARADEPSPELYRRLRRCNPATFAGYFDLGDFQILSASPERFLKVLDGWVEARPIKGTRQRTSQPEADLFAGSDLLQSEKDRSENVMIVDLMRNDLSRVCQPDSVSVPQLCELEVYAYVQHLVSAVRGELQPDAGPLDLLRSAFPAGSITGAPKVRAMEIIAELEPTSRGPYCGSLGYITPSGEMDLSVLIRTITAGRGWWQLPVGGGIVAQSDPALELEETWHKAEGLLRALGPAWS